MNNKLALAKILIVGDIMLDRYYDGNTDRISPEAPVPVVHIKKIEDRAGGAANVALNIAALQGKAAIAGMIGKDEPGEIIEDILKKNKIKTYLSFSEKPTITKMRVISQKQQLLRMDFEESMVDVKKQSLIESIDKTVKDFNVVVFSDYAKGTLSGVLGMIAPLVKSGCKVLVDPKGLDYSIYRDASLITPNMKEFELVVGHCKNDEDMINKALTLIENFNFGAVLITRGSKGMTLVKSNKEHITIPARAKEVYDVTGAGDTVIAVIAMAIDSGYTLEDSIYLANIAASIAVGKVGVAMVSPDELYEAMHQKNLQTTRGILSQDDLIKSVAKAKLQGEKIVMTNGCFDILHAGHVEYLQQARKFGDSLIVAVNSDNSVKELKGKARPIVPLASRMQMLEALECVDWVISFDETTPEKIIAKILPDVLIKGADYTVENIAGASQVIKNGGEVKTIKLKPESSTSLIIDKINKMYK